MSACPNHGDLVDATVTNQEDTCFAIQTYDVFRDCVEDSTLANYQIICDCETYLSAVDETCVVCPVGTWVGKSRHRLGESYCAPKRIFHFVSPKYEDKI